MDIQSSRNKAVPGTKKEHSQESSQFKTVSAAFLELFELLEEYAPSWYTEEHHNRAVAAQRILMKSRGAAAT